MDRLRCIAVADFESSRGCVQCIAADAVFVPGEFATDSSRRHYLNVECCANRIYRAQVCKSRNVDQILLDRVDDQLIILIQCAQFSGVHVGVGGSTAQRIVLLDEFAILKDPDTLSSIRSVPVHHDSTRSAARCRCANINLDPLQIVHSRRDVNYFLDPNLATANSWWMIYE
jgi:hypothetical protein